MFLISSISQGDRTLLTGLEHTVEELVPVKGLTASVLLDDDHRQNFHRFIGSEAVVALEAFPAAADTGPVVGGAGIDDLTVEGGAKRTFHRAETS